MEEMPPPNEPSISPGQEGYAIQHPHTIQRQVLEFMAAGWYLFILGKSGFRQIVEEVVALLPDPSRQCHQLAIQDFHTQLTLLIIAVDPMAISAERIMEMATTKGGRMEDSSPAGGVPVYFVPVNQASPTHHEDMEQSSQLFQRFIHQQIPPPRQPYREGPLPIFTPSYLARGVSLRPEVTNSIPWRETGSPFVPWVRVFTWMYFTTSHEFGTFYTMETRDMQEMVSCEIGGETPLRIDTEESRRAEVREREAFLIQTIKNIDDTRALMDRSVAQRAVDKLKGQGHEQEGS